MKRNRKPIEPGSHLHPFLLHTVAGGLIQIPDPGGKLIHLQFLRWAGCSICNLALMRYRRRAADLSNANVREIIVFHSSVEDIREIQSSLPFELVADPDKALYRRFAVGSSLFFLLHPRTLMTWVKSLAVESNLKMTNGPFGLPADFLIAPDGNVVAAKYGKYADDSWTVDDLLALAESYHSNAQKMPQPMQEKQEILIEAVPTARESEGGALAGFTPDTPTPDTLTPKKIAILVAFTVPIWFGAAMFIRFRGPQGVFVGARAMVLYFLTIPFTMPLNWWSRHIVRLPRHEMTNVIAVTAATAILLDGFAMNRFPGLYGSDPAVIAGGAAWLLWAVGVALTLALVTASSSPRR